LGTGAAAATLPELEPELAAESMLNELDPELDAMGSADAEPLMLPALMELEPEPVGICMEELDDICADMEADPCAADDGDPLAPVCRVGLIVTFILETDAATHFTGGPLVYEHSYPLGQHASLQQTALS